MKDVKKRHLEKIAAQKLKRQKIKRKESNTRDSKEAQIRLEKGLRGKLYCSF